MVFRQFLYTSATGLNIQFTPIAAASRPAAYPIRYAVSVPSDAPASAAVATKVPSFGRTPLPPSSQFPAIRTGIRLYFWNRRF